MGIFIACLIVVFLLSTVLYKKYKVRYSVSFGLLVLIILSIVATICLAQNYTQSIIPNIEDGIGISNRIAYLIIGEDGWTQCLFKSYFDASVYITIILLVLFLLSVTIESSRGRKK